MPLLTAVRGRFGADWHRTFHLLFTWTWAVLLVPGLVWWSESIMWVIVMSTWANFAGHFAALEAVELSDEDVDRVAKATVKLLEQEGWHLIND